MKELTYNVAPVMEESSKLLQQIANARGSLRSSSIHLEQVQQHREVLEKAKTQVHRLYDEYQAILTENTALERQRDALKNETAALETRLASIKWQTQATESYLQTLDLTVEAALRAEEEVDAVENRRTGRAGAVDSSETEIAWSREEEIEYLELEETQQALVLSIRQHNEELTLKSTTLKDMVSTLSEGEAAVRKKHRECSDMEKEMDMWRDRFEAFLRQADTELVGDFDTSSSGNDDASHPLK